MEKASQQRQLRLLVCEHPDDPDEGPGHRGPDGHRGDHHEDHDAQEGNPPQRCFEEDPEAQPGSLHEEQTQALTRVEAQDGITAPPPMGGESAGADVGEEAQGQGRLQAERVPCFAQRRASRAWIRLLASRLWV